jgi:hypothetical protein
MNIFCLPVFIATACAPGHPGSNPADARPPMPEGLAGCYALFVRGGRPASDSLYFAPSHVRLLTTRREPTLISDTDSTFMGWALTKLDSQLWGMHSTRDSVMLAFHTGLSGSLLFFGIPPGPVDTLHGRAEEHWDFGPPFSNDGGPVMAVRVPCRAG